MAELQPFAPADLMIDEMNPRLSTPNVGQPKALQALAKHLGTKLRVLAEDIVNYGADPSTLPIVMPLAGSSRYVVLEGNRRLVALRALENPDSVSGVEPGILRSIRKLSKKYQESPVETLMCVVVNDRDEARHWIELRHTGERGGAGTVRWSSDEADRFRSRGAVPPHTQVLEFLQRQGVLSDEVRRKVPTTSLRRLIEAPRVRSKLGVELADKVLYLLADEASVAKAMMHVVDDLVSGRKRVGDIYTKEQREKYAAGLPANIVVTPTIKSGHGIALADAGTGKPPKTKPSRKVHKLRDKLIPKDCILSIPVARKRVGYIEGELRKLSLEDHANAVSVLFRVFIELCADAYREKHLPHMSEDAALQKKLEAIVNDLVTRKKLNAQQAKPVRRACQRDSFLAPSMTLIHQYVHNQYVFPAPSDLRAHWDSLQPFMIAMWAV